MKPKELLFLAVAFFLGYFANTVINMTCGRPVVEGAIPKCRGRWLGMGDGDHRRFSDYGFPTVGKGAGGCPPPDSEYSGSWDYCIDGSKVCHIPPEGQTWDDVGKHNIQCGRKPNQHSALNYETHECQ